MPQISPETKSLIKKYSKTSTEKEETTVKVDEIAVRVASFYEKIRGVIDWQGEQFLKRGAIGRVLKRKIFSQINISDGKFSKDHISAEKLIVELIRSGHFKNETIGESKIEEVQKVIDKHIYIIKSYPAKNGSRLNFYKWLSSIAVCEIEEILSPAEKNRALIHFMYQHMKDMIEIEEEVKEKDKLIYIAVQQALFDLDEQIITYHLLKQEYENWNNLQGEELEKVAKEIPKTKERMEGYFKHPFLKKIYQACKVYNTPFLIIGDMLEEGVSNIEDPEAVESKIKKHYEKRVKAMRGKLSRIATYTTISIFMTNIVALLAVEIPFAKYVMGSFSYTAIAVDVLVPTLLMTLLVVTIELPPKRNEKKVILETMKVIYEGKKDVFKIKKTKKRKFNFIMSSIYSLFFLFSVGVIVWLLQKIDFPPLSYFIFIIFLSLIAFAGVKIRERAKELHMIESKEGFVSFFIDLFAIPIIQLGRWLSLRWERYNVVSIFFNAFIDMPFMLFVEFLEQWRGFIKEKKEELY